MSFTYVKSLSSDFSNNFDQYIFREEIQNSLITGVLLEVILSGDQIDVTFNAELSVDDLNKFNNLVENHDPSEIDKLTSSYKTIPVSTKIKSSKSNNWQLVSTYDYHGTSNVSEIKYIDIISKANPSSGTLSYDFRVINLQTGQVIANKTGFTNDTFQANDLGAITNLPESRSMLEIHCKIASGSGNINIQNINIY
tara:strand:- start:788 stop:1375 length:588 start_codon:yes stop_codon:yes gene_type:complete